MRAMLLILIGCAGGEEAPLSQEDFQEEYGALACAETAICNPDMECMAGSTDVPESCAYDAAKAEQCLEGDWTCNTHTDGFEYAEAPPVCNEVYSCSGT